MVSVIISVTAEDPTPGPGPTGFDYGRVWAIYVDSPPGAYLGNGEWSNPNPLARENHLPGQTMTVTTDLAAGDHNIYFVVSSTDPSLGTYSGTISLNGQTVNFSGVNANSSADVTISVSGSGQQTITVNGHQVPVPAGSTDALVLNIYLPFGGIPVISDIIDAVGKELISLQGYQVTGAALEGSDLVVFINSPTGGIIPVAVAVIIVAAIILIGIYIVAYTVMDISSNQLYIQQSKQQIADSITSSTSLTPAQKAAILENLTAPTPTSIPSWATGIGVAVGVGVAGYAAISLINSRRKG